MFSFVLALAVESVPNQNPSVNATANSLLDAAKSNFSLNKVLSIYSSLIEGFNEFPSLHIIIR